MPHFSARLAHAVAERHGIVTRSQLISDDLSERQIGALVAAHSIVPIHSGVYRVTTSPDTFASRCAAACAADAELTITGPSAARLWRFRQIHASDVPIAMVSHARHPTASGVVLRRTNVLDPVDRVQRNDGIVIASPPRTWFECARDVNDETFEATTEWVLDHHTTLPSLWRTVRRLEARGRPGLARVRRVLSQRSGWQKPADSKLELRVLRGLRSASVPELVRQYPIRLPNGVTVHCDGADPAVRWAIEVDHVTWHGGRLDAQRDKARDRALRRIDWQVERVTDHELATDFDAVIREVAALYHLRARSVAG